MSANDPKRSERPTKRKQQRWAWTKNLMEAIKVLDRGPGLPRLQPPDGERDAEAFRRQGSTNNRWADCLRGLIRYLIARTLRRSRRSSPSLQ
jgi:hypothetical protein